MEPSRKKIKRVVNSCLECRRRKIRCDLSANSSSRCGACAARDTPCEKWRDPEGSPDSNTIELGARLRRVEGLLQKLTDDDPGVPALLNEVSDTGAVTAPIETGDRPPLVSLFDNAVFGQPDDAEASEVNVPTAGSGFSGFGDDGKQEKLRLVLTALLPTQADADRIVSSTNAWGLSRMLYINTDRRTNARLDIAAAAEGSPLAVCATLLQFAILIQQLPPEFDMTVLDVKSSTQALLQKYLYYVTDLVTSKDDFACTLPGLECLLLQTLFYHNDGNLRRAWLAGRRCLYVAQFLGLQKSYLRYWRNPEASDDVEKTRAILWSKNVIVDRYLAPILGLPSGVGDDCFGDDPVFLPFDDSADVLERRLCVIAGLIAARNQKDPPAGYNTTLDIDEKLERVIKDLGDAVTEIPPLSNLQRSIEEDDAFKVVLNQMWLYQLALFLHIPWMLRAFSDRKFEYSRFACLHAAREQLKRYLALQSTNNTQGTARVVDFAITIASATLILNQVGCSTNSALAKLDMDDEPLVLQTLESMRIVSRGPREFLARQGVEAIETLLALKNSDQRIGTNARVRITIPFFGPIDIHRSASQQRPSQPIVEPQLTETMKAPDDMPGNIPDNMVQGTSQDVVSDAFVNNGIFAANNGIFFDHSEMSEPGWLPPLEAWDFDNVPAGGDYFGLWDVSSWQT